ncbi:AAA family ATPase [Mycobacterium sp. SMC-14]|uniref:AAA family ATPase n=1 Tax=Mycobacterium sp. SMC-14 TaxID=3385968 RepID=UPI00390C7E28
MPSKAECSANGTGQTAADDGPDAPAQWVSGTQWADALNVDPETPIADHLGVETWHVVRKFSRQFDVSMYLPDGANSMAFSDFNALPSAVLHAASPPVSLTRAQVAEFAADTITDDPHVIGARLKRARWERFDRKKRTDAALNSRKIPSTTAYTLDEIGAVAGPEVAERCRQLIEDANRRAWSHPKPHSYREREYVMTAAELVGTIGVAVEVIADMTAATDAERNAALADLAIARIRHGDSITARARAGSVPALDLDAEVLTLSGLAEIEPVRPLITGLLARGQLADLNGAPGSGKTMAAVGMSGAVASGRRWCGHVVPERAPVLYVAAEGASGISARLHAWCEINGVAPEDIEDTFIIAPRAVQMGDDGHMAQVRDLVKRHGVALVVFDTRARCTVGVEENSATDHGRVIAHADEINSQTGAAVLVVHHTAAGSDRARGTTAWDGAVWSSLLLTRTGARKGKKSRKVEITCAKHKEWPDGCTHEFRLAGHTVSEALMPDATAAQRSTLVLAPVDPYTAEPDDERSLSVTQAEILALVAELGGGEGLTRAEIVRFAEERSIAGRSSVYAAVTALLDKGRKLVKVPGTQRLAARELIDGAPDTKDAVTAVGSPIYTAAVDTIIESLCARRAEGRITDDMAKTDAHKLVGGHVVPYAEAWARWSVNRPTDPGQVDKLNEPGGP